MISRRTFVRTALFMVLLALMACRLCRLFLPPGTKPTKLPISASMGGLTVTIQRLKRDQSVVFCDFTLQADRNVHLADRYDLKDIALSGSTWSGESFKCWSPHQWTNDETGDPPSKATFFAYT